MDDVAAAYERLNGDDDGRTDASGCVGVEPGGGFELPTNAF